MDSDGRAAQLAAEQGGVLRTDQALELGLTHRTITYRVKTGRWHRLSRSVYRLFAMGSVEDRLRAAVIALPGAVVSHESAAELLGVGSVRRGLAVVTVHSQTTHDFLDVLVHRSHDLDSSHLTQIHGLPATNMARTVIDLASVLRPRHTASIMDDLVAAKKLAIDDVRNIADQVLRRGKPGSAILKQLLEDRSDGPEANASRLERVGFRLLSEAGLPEPRLEYPIPWDPRRRFDLAYPEFKLAVEWDSRRWHTQVDAFERDRARDRQAVRNGWRVLRCTWQDLTTRPGDIVDTVRSLLDL